LAWGCRLGKVLGEGECSATTGHGGRANYRLFPPIWVPATIKGDVNTMVRGPAVEKPGATA
jgi:hypothetical protein